MATVREGRRAALLVVDLQVGVVRRAWEAPRVLARVAALVARARARGVPVVWVQHGDDELPPGSPDWQWAPPLAPAPGEPRIDKRHNSAFEQTGLDATLATLGVSHLVLAGAASNWCIRATAHAALERGYDLTLVSDGHTTEDLDFDDGTRIAAADIVRELNTAMRWMAWPGRRNAVAESGAVGFDGPAGA